MSYDDPHESRSDDRPSSRLSGFYNLDLDERLDVLREQGILEDDAVSHFQSPESGLDRETADQMIENAIGTLELPLGLGLNFIVNGREYVVPMAVEEPSVVAAVSHSAKTVRRSGGFQANCDASLMIGQIQVLDVPDPERARDALIDARERLLAAADECHPDIVEHGGGARDLEVRMLEREQAPSMLVVHLIVDVCDAMGANIVNTMAEGVAPLVEDLTEGRVSLRILSNLADKRLAHAQCRIPIEHMEWKEFSGRRVAEGIAEASAFAQLDPYRAATHNKGVMNGMSAVCIATGNDWRALEAGAHAYCCRDGQYRPMATWSIEEDNYLVGRLTAPMQIGTVGGPVRVHPTVQIDHDILDVEGAGELGEVIAAVGLAQNLGALKALATEGIQHGHMALHARSVAAAAGAESDEVSELVDRLVERGEIDLETARSLLDDMRS